MKNYWFYLAIAGLLSACGNSQTTETDGNSENNVPAIDSSYCNCDELVFDQPYNHFYRFEKRKGFTGKCDEFFPTGKLKASKNFVEGKLHGKQITYYENGSVHEEKEFDMNFQTGEQIIYALDGQVKYHALYNRGKQTHVLVSRPELLEEDPWN